MVLLAKVSIITVYIFYRIAKKLFLKWQANKDRSYNVFDRAVLSSSEKSLMKKWLF